MFATLSIVSFFATLATWGGIAVKASSAIIATWGGIASLGSGFLHSLSVWGGIS